MAPLLAQHRNAIFLNEALFRRIAELKEREVGLGLSAEQSRVLERYHTAFLRQGAGLPAETKRRLAEISERLATLGTKFGQNLLADEKAYTQVLESEADLAGLPDFLRDAAAKAAADRNMSGKHVITLARSLIELFLQFSARRDLREAAFKAWVARGENSGETDNRPIITETVALRAERARLLGYANFAEFRLDDSMAKTPETALGLLHSVWMPARAQAMREREALQEIVQAEGDNFELAPWDWRYYSEKRRQAQFDFDEGQIKPYLQLDRMIEAAFYTAGRLFGLSFTDRRDLPLYHPDVRAWEVTGADGQHVGLFLGDYFARPSKRSGAWMSGFRGQEKLAGDIRPIIVNVMNFNKAAEGEPALLSFDDARTLFHEFGHALHGLLSDVTYPMIAGTSVSRDFVEFPRSSSSTGWSSRRS
jgi:peptidyl-dipeptidase Dcp